MTSLTQSPHSVSSGGSPETYHQNPMAAGPIYPHKNTYRHIPGHAQGVGNTQPYGSVVVANGSGVQYPSPMAVPGGQYYPSIPNTGFLPVYGGAALAEHPYYYYQGPNGNWTAMPGPLHVYPPQHGYTTSPPATPPQPQLPYGYPMVTTDFLPPSPPQASYPNHGHHHHHHHVPGLDHRRNSWSSSGATDTPTTPFSTNVDPVPAIVDEHQGNAHGEDRDIKDLSKHVESMLLSGPPVPPPIPAIYAPGVSTLAQTLDNPTNTTNVYIRGLPPDTDDDKLYEMTCRFGTVVSHKAIMDTEHGTCKGYGFARYETKQQAEDCIRGLVSLKYEAGFARESFNARLKTLADPNSTNIYVSNLPRSMTEKDMQDIFAGYVVVSNRILRDANGASRGVGFARFESREICNEIIKNFHGFPVGEEALALQVRYADTSAQKRLKATTTKKRQFRSNEYNSVVNSSYYNQPHMPYGSASQFRNRVWLRHNPMASNYSGEPSQDPQSSSGSIRKNWDRSQDWKNTGDENRDWNWRNSISGDTLSKLETVHEDDDDIVSETRSEAGTTIPGLLESIMRGSVSKASSGSVSDPGDSYGGREYRSKDDSFIS